MTQNTPAGFARTNPVAKYLLEAATRAGICLITHGGKVHAIPSATHLAQHPRLHSLVKRHRFEIAEYLDDLVE